MAEFGFANCPTQVESGHTRHHPVAHDDTDICLFGAGEAFQALTRILRLVPPFFEQCADGHKRKAGRRSPVGPTARRRSAVIGREGPVLRRKPKCDGYTRRGPRTVCFARPSSLVRPAVIRT